jgi:hypothetical protein
VKRENTGKTGKGQSQKGVEAGKAESLLGFCDLMCEYAETPKETGVDGSGSCRTFVALYCSAKKSLVHKNMPCRQKAMKNN